MCHLRNPHHLPAYLQDDDLVQSWAELKEVDEVERVLTPVSVSIIALSNITLLLHEARLVWRTRRLIPPKLLVLVLSLADLLATILGYFPLWILFVTDPECTDIRPHADSMSTLKPMLNVSDLTLTSTGSGGGLTTVTTAWEESTTAQSVLSPHSPGPQTFQETAVKESMIPPNPSPPQPPMFEGQRYHEVVKTVEYSVFFFLLTSFWTLAQCTVVMMGIERFLALRAPYFYAARCTCLAFLGVVGVMTALSCGLGGLQLAMHLADVQGYLLVYAGFLASRSLASNVSTLMQGLLCTSVLLLCNWVVTRELRRMEGRVTVMRVKDHSDYMKQMSMVHGAGREFARFMMAVNAVFLLASAPNLVCVILRLSNVPPHFSIQYFCWRMSHISAALNPFLYGFLRKSLRSRIRHFLNQHVPCVRPQRVADDSSTDPGPSTIRFENRGSCHHHHRRACGTTPSSDIIPRDPEASVIFSE